MAGAVIWLIAPGETVQRGAAHATGGMETVNGEAISTDDSGVPVLPEIVPLTPEVNSEIETIKNELAAMTPIQPGEIANEIAMDLLRSWAAREPGAAILFAADHPELHGEANFPAELFASWMEQHEAAALAWVARRPKNALRSQLMPLVLGHVATTDPHVAFLRINELEGESRKSALTAVFSEWAESDPARAAEQASQISDGAERNVAMTEVAKTWADHDINAAVEWAKQLPPPEANSLDTLPSVLEAVIEKWTESAPEDAARFLLSASEDPRKIQMLGALSAQWAVRDPKEALQWVSDNAKGPDQDILVRGVLAAVAETNMQAAADLVLNLPKGGAQQQGMEMILGQWTASRPADMAIWACDLFKDPTKGEKLGAMAEAWAGTDVTSLGKWLNTLPKGEARDTCCAAIARQLAGSHPDVAVEWIGTIGNASLRQKEMAAIKRSR